jgi:Ca2+-binding EF-hand superfamily protein
MSFVNGPKRVVRNPITGEELVYVKGQKIEALNYMNSENSSSSISMKELLAINDLVQNNKSNKLTDEKMQTTFRENTDTPSNSNTKSEFMSKINSSMIETRGNSIPILNLSELVSEDRRFNQNENNDKNNQQINYKQELENLVKKNNIDQNSKNNQKNNPIFGGSANESARPKSSYRYGFNQNLTLDSPIMKFQNKLDQNSIKESSTIPSKLDTPRTLNHNKDSLLLDQPFLLLPKPPQSQKKESFYMIERVADLEKLWLENSGMTPLPHERVNVNNVQKQETDEKTKLIKEKLVIDTIVTDQLSKFPLSRAETYRDSANNPLSLKTIYTSRGNRHTIVDNHMRPISSLSENVLSKKCKFSCRVKTPNGKLALKELFGLVFLYDGSLTIYEFRLLCGAYVTGMGSGNTSKKTTALPFLNRKVYKHAFGRRKDKQIEIWDIYKGAILYLNSNESGFYEIEITDVDEVEKENLLTKVEIENTSLLPHEVTANIHEIKNRLKQPLTEIEINDRKILGSIRQFMRKQIENRSIEVYMGLSSILKSISSRKAGNLSQQDLHNALLEYNVQIHSEDLNIAWQVLDLNQSGQLSYYVLIRAVFGEMNSFRHAHFRNLVRKLDSQKLGYIQTNDIYKFYRIARHPKVKSGDMKEEEFKKNFLSVFDLLEPSSITDFNELSTSTDAKSPLITYEQFEEYYNGLSIIIDSDDEFLKIIKNSWNLI